MNSIDAAATDYLDAQAARYQRELDDADDRESAIEKLIEDRREDWIDALANGETFKFTDSRGRKICLDWESIEMEASGLPIFSRALKLARTDQLEAGVLLLRSIREAAESLIDIYQADIAEKFLLECAV